MNNTLKRLLSLALAVVMVMSYGIMPVSAEDGESGEHTHVWAGGSCECGAVCDHAGAVVTETAPTCTEPGAKTSTCSTCGNISTETIPATGHTYVEGVCTCGAEEEPAQTDLTDEGEGEEEGGEAPDTHTCDFAEEVSNTATCTEAGVKTMKCACGETQEVESPAKGHAYGDGTVTTEPTCTTEGVLTKTCGCGETTTEAIEMLAHSYVDGKCACGELDYDFDWCTALGCTEEAHHAECPFGPCTLTPGCQLVKGHELLGAPCDVAVTFDVNNITNEVELRAALQSAGTITLTITQDITLENDDIDITDSMDVTIQGEGKTITAANGKDAFYVTGGKLTLASGLNVVAPTDCCIYIRGGEVITSANLTKNGEKYSVIQGNGQYVGDVTIMGGTITNEIPNKCAINWPQNGKLTIEGGSITGGTGIRLTSGSLEITGGTITANGTKQDYVASNGGSVVDTGDALMVENIGGTSGYEELGTVSITGGTFTSTNAAAVGSYTAGNEGVEAKTGFIRGGNFSSDISSLVLFGFEYANGSVIESTELKVTNAEELTTACAIAEGRPVTLQNDITLTDTVFVSDHNSVTLNLNTHNITSASEVFKVSGSLTLTGTGTVESTGTDTIVMQNGGSLTVSDNATVKSTSTNGCAIFVPSGANGCTLNVAGTVTNTSSNYATIYTNGTTTGTTLTITGAVTANGDVAAVFLSGTGTYTVSGNAAISGNTGMIVEGGTLTITGGILTGDGAVKNTYTPNGNGGVETGEALELANEQGILSVSITGGNFNGGSGAQAVGSYGVTPVTGFITKGTFSSDPSAYVPTGYEATKAENVWTVDVKAMEDTQSDLTAGTPSIEAAAGAPGVDTNDEKVVAANQSASSDLTQQLKDTTNAAAQEVVKTAVAELATKGVTEEDALVPNIVVEKRSSEAGSYSYDITPVMQAYAPENVDNEGKPLPSADPKAQVEMSKLPTPIEVKIPVPVAITTNCVKLTHEHNGETMDKGEYEVMSNDKDGRHISYTTDLFSVMTVSAGGDKLVASVNGNSYSSLAEALEKATSGSTVKLLTDVTVTGHLLYVPAGVTLDGKKSETENYTITAKDNLGTSSSVFYGGKGFTIQNLNIANEGATLGYAVHIEDDATLNNVTVGDSFSVCGVFVENGEANISNCTFNNSNGWGVSTDQNSTATVTLTGNTFKSPNGAILYTESTVSNNVFESAVGISVADSEVEVTGNTFTGAKALEIHISNDNITNNNFGSSKISVEPTFGDSVQADLSKNYWAGGKGPGENQIENKGTTTKPVTVTVNSFYTDDDMKQDDLAPGDDARVICGGVYYSTINGALGSPVQLVKGKSFTEVLTRGVTINQLGLNGSLGVSLNEGDIVTVKSSGEVVIQPAIEPDGRYAFTSVKYGKDSVDAQVIFVEPETTLSITSTTSEFDDAAFSGEFMKDLNYKDGLDKGDFKAYFPTYDNRYVKGTDETLIVESTGFFNTCLQIFVDDIEVYDAADEYEKSGVDVKVGCTRLELTSKFLKTLSTGDYTVTFVHKLGNETFEVKETIKIRDDSSKADETNPKTGDFIMMPMAIMTLSAAALAVLLIGKKKHA